MARTRTAVSGPGKGSKRTDLAPGGGGQPIRVAPAEQHGDRQRMEGLQKAAPLASGVPGSPGASAPSVFRPTDRQGEPVQAGIPFGPGSNGVGAAGDLDFYQLIQVLHSIVPDPALARMLVVPPGLER